MHRQNNISTATASIITGTNENKRKNQKKDKVFVGTPVTNKFFQPRTTPSTPLPLKSIINNPNNKLQKFVDREINRTSIIYSEDVSRKKMKLDETCKMKKFFTKTKDGTEDFLENLKKNIDKKMMSQPILESESRVRKKTETKKKMLFDDESLKLMNNFKEYFKDKDIVANKDNILQQSDTKEASLKQYSSKFNTFVTHKNNDYQNNASEKNDPFVHTKISQTSNDVISIIGCSKFHHSNQELKMPALSNCSTFVLKKDFTCNESQLQRNESGLTKILLNTTPIESFTTGTAMISDRETNPDELFCPTPPQVEAMSLRYTERSQREDFTDNSYYLSYF